MKSVSLIIPFFNELDEIKKILSTIPNWTLLPNEILIINTAFDQAPTNIKNYDSSFRDLGIDFRVISDSNALPGQARNTGVRSSKFEYLAFLDSKPLPDENWLKENLLLAEQMKAEIVLGKTLYVAESIFEKNIRLATFGSNTLSTLPGSLIKKNLFGRVGQFVEHVRAGEDGDWIGRLKLQKINYYDSPQPIKYLGLKKMTFVNLVKKWFRNYLSSTQLPHLKAHKDIYFYFTGFALLLLAFNWNNLSYDPDISGWNTDSIFYIPNITKTIFALLVIIYFLVRSIILPINKGATIFDLLPINFITIFIISLILDITKISAFLYGSVRNILNKISEFLSIKDNGK